MKFTVRIQSEQGRLRTAVFDSSYDATAVLESQIERDILRPGETIAQMPSPNQGGPMDRRTKVPAIERVA